MADKPVSPLSGRVISRNTRQSNKTGKSFGIIRILLEASALTAFNELVAEALCDSVDAYAVGSKVNCVLAEAQYGKLSVRIV